MLCWQNILPMHQEMLRIVPKTIQNEIINIAADFIRNDIVKEIQQAKTFSILADETSDISVNEQLS